MAKEVYPRKFYPGKNGKTFTEKLRETGENWKNFTKFYPLDVTSTFKFEVSFGPL